MSQSALFEPDASTKANRSSLSPDAVRRKLASINNSPQLRAARKAARGTKQTQAQPQRHTENAGARAALASTRYAVAKADAQTKEHFAKKGEPMSKKRKSKKTRSAKQRRADKKNAARLRAMNRKRMQKSKPKKRGTRRASVGKPQTPRNGGQPMAKRSKKRKSKRGGGIVARTSKRRTSARSGAGGGYKSIFGIKGTPGLVVDVTGGVVVGGLFSNLVVPRITQYLPASLQGPAAQAFAKVGASAAVAVPAMYFSKRLRPMAAGFLAAAVMDVGVGYVRYQLAKAQTGVPNASLNGTGINPFLQSSQPIALQGVRSKQYAAA